MHVRIIAIYLSHNREATDVQHGLQQRITAWRIGSRKIRTTSNLRNPAKHATNLTVRAPTRHLHLAIGSPTILSSAAPTASSIVLILTATNPFKVCNKSHVVPQSFYRTSLQNTTNLIQIKLR